MNAAVSFIQSSVGIFLIIVLMCSFSLASEMWLPSELSSYIKTKFSGWKIVTLKDLNADDREMYLTDHPKGCPGIATWWVGSHKQFAVVIIPENMNSGKAKLIVFNKKSTGYKETILSESDVGATPVIFTVPPGTYESYDGTKKVTTKSPAIFYVGYESWVVMFYWANGKYHKLQISD